MESYTLFQLNEYIKRVIALNFREPLWIEAEIVQVKLSRGNYYLELIEKAENTQEVIAQASAAVWYRNYQFIAKKLGAVLDDLLKDGSAVRLKVRVDFNERYGFKLLIEDIDASYTFGKYELNRQQILLRLEKEGLISLNKELTLPAVIQKIAIISSEKSAGYQDFIQQLTGNSYGYRFEYTLFDVAVQGAKVEAETLSALHQIKSQRTQYDAVVIIRGGGSKLDLAAYDNFPIAQAIALSEIPFIIGIGHDIDSTVVDLVSCVSLKTPTAVADYLIELASDFESSLIERMTIIQRLAQSSLHSYALQLSNVNERLALSTRSIINRQIDHTLIIDEQLIQLAQRRVDKEQTILEKLALQIDQRDPMLILKQGYSYVLKKGKNIKRQSQLSANDKVTIVFYDKPANAQILD